MVNGEMTAKEDHSGSFMVNTGFFQIFSAAGTGLFTWMTLIHTRSLKKRNALIMAEMNSENPVR